MKFQFGRYTWRPMVLLKNIVIVAIILLTLLIFVEMTFRALKVNECQHYRNPNKESFSQCMETR